MVVLRLVLAWENAKRDRFQGVHNGQDNVEWHADSMAAREDRTDCKNKDFRYLL